MLRYVKWVKGAAVKNGLKNVMCEQGLKIDSGLFCTHMYNAMYGKKTTQFDRL